MPYGRLFDLLVFSCLRQWTRNVFKEGGGYVLNKSDQHDFCLSQGGKMELAVSHPTALKTIPKLSGDWKGASGAVLPKTCFKQPHQQIALGERPEVNLSRGRQFLQGR